MLKIAKLLVPVLCLSACVGVTEQSSNSLTPSVVAPAAPAGAQEAQDAAMPSGALVAAPRQYETYCATNPADCTIPATPAITASIQKSDHRVLKMVKPTEEAVDVWSSLDKPGPGDCEDFALTLRKQLRERFPAFAGAFRIATAYIETGEYHAVLTVETSQGTMVCDIRYKACAPWQSFPYHWRLREIPGSTKWQELGPYRLTPEQLKSKAKLIKASAQEKENTPSVASAESVQDTASEEAVQAKPTLSDPDDHMIAPAF